MMIEGGARWGYDPIWYRVGELSESRKLKTKSEASHAELCVVKFQSKEIESLLVILQ